MLFDYIDGAAYDEKTMGWNEADFDRVRFFQRPLAGIAETSLGVSVLGAEQALPLVIAPAGFTGLMARRGEVQAARAAKAAGIPQCLSTVSIASMAEVKRDSGVDLWLQLYVTRDRGIARDLLAQATAAGCPVLAVTVDISSASRRERDVRNHFSLGSDRRLRDWLDMAWHFRWLLDMARAPRLSFGNLQHLPGAGRGLMSQAGFVTRHLDYSLNWRDIEWLRREWTGKFIVKGITHPDDARRVLAAGADGLVVSNHGGRQLDTGLSTIAALPGVVEAVGEQPRRADGQRHPARQRRDQGARPRRQGLPDRPCVSVWPRRARRGRRHAGAGHPQGRNGRHPRAYRRRRRARTPCQAARIPGAR